MIGVVGPTEAVERLAAALDAGGVEVGPAEAVLAGGPSAVVAVGEAAVCSLVAAGVDVPLVPVEAGEGLASVGVEGAPEVVERGLESGFETREHPVVEVVQDGEALGRGLFDAMFVTREPARISEFAVETPAGVDRFRADGVVVATPVGSAGYTRALGGPVVDPGTGSLVVVPVAPFAVRPTVRVTPGEATLSVRVLRDEGEISLLVDGTAVGAVPPERPVTVGVDGAVTVVDPVDGGTRRPSA